MARLIAKARQLGRPVHLRGIPVHDIFDLLDDTALRAVFQQWPGHALAQAAHERDDKSMHPKQFREREYGMPMHEVFWYAHVADQMRSRPPAALERVMRGVEQAAADAQV